MYQIVSNLFNYPQTGGNSTILYVTGVVILLVFVTVIDMVYRLIRSVTKSIERR